MTDNAAETNQGRFHRKIRSFVLRAGRMTEGQQKAYDRCWPQWGLALSDGMIDYQAVFGNDHPVVFEIGFGMGDSLAQMAAAAPELNFIGVEVHKPGVGRLLNLAEQQGLTNLRVYQDDAVEVLAQCISDASLHRLQLYFPDPWHKKKHHKRRIAQPAFIEQVGVKLTPGGVLHMATDWEPYAEHMVEVMVEAEGFENTAESGAYVEKPDYRPETKFERRGERLGHGVWDLVYRKI